MRISRRGSRSRHPGTSISSRGDLNDLHFGKTLAHPETLVGAVVDEHEGVETETELVGQPPQVLGLGIPVDPHRREVLLPEHLVGMLAKDLEHVRFVVLAAEGEHQPPLLVVQQPPLERHVHVTRVVRTQGDAVGTVLTDHAAPQGVVRVEGDDLGPRTLEERADGDDPPRDLLGGHRGKREARAVPPPPVEEPIPPDRRQALVEIDEGRRRQVRLQVGREVDLQPGPPGRFRARGVDLVVTESRLVHRREEGHQQVPRHGPPHGAQLPAQMGTHRGRQARALSGRECVPRTRQPGIEVLPAEKQHRQVGPVPDEAGSGAGLLDDRAVGPVIDMRLEPLQEGLEPQIRVERLAGVSAQDTEAQRHAGLVEPLEMPSERLDLRQGQARASWWREARQHPGPRRGPECPIGHA